MGSRIFRFSLLVLAAAFLEHAILFIYLYNSGNAPPGRDTCSYETYYDFTLHCVLAFSAMAMWSETQIDRIRELATSWTTCAARVQHTLDLDRLTGLLNQAALARRIESAGAVSREWWRSATWITSRTSTTATAIWWATRSCATSAICCTASIRHEDEAFRWGGDEFVILFQNQRADVATKRMPEIEARLREFRVRGFGVLPITFSWGTAEARGRTLREALDEADRNMYSLKRTRVSARSGR